MSGVKMMKRTVKILTPPTEEQMLQVLSLDEAKSHLRVDFNDDDDYIKGLIFAAIQYAEGFQKRSIAPYTLQLTQDQFGYAIPLRRGPVKNVVSVEYTLLDGTVKEVSSDSYIFSADEQLVPKTWWPSEALQGVDGVKVIYNTGYDTVPATTKQALKLLVGHWYENREPVGQVTGEIPFSSQALLWMDRSW